MYKDDRVIILMGAGAVADGGGIGTYALTKEIVERCGRRDECKNAIQLIIEGFRQIYHIDISHDIYSYVNFEDIFHVVELLYGYMLKTNGKQYTPYELVFMKLQDSFNDTVNLENINALKSEILSTINDIIYAYDTKISDTGKWFIQFFKNLEKNSNLHLDIFTLNYDTWVEQSLSSYTDGYIDITDSRYHDKMMRFDASPYLRCDSHRVSHLHGQIFFEYPNFDSDDEDSKSIGFKEPLNTLYKYKSYDEVCDLRKCIWHSGDTTQTGHYLYRTNLITGMMKTDKIMWHPFDIYFAEFMNALVHYNKLIIIGYGFFDVYINRLLTLFNSVHNVYRRIVLIDYIPNEKLTHIIEHPFSSSSDKALFSNLMFQDDDWWDKRKYSLEQDNMQQSDDKQGLLCVKGFQWASSHSDEIIEFLRS